MKNLTALLCAMLFAAFTARAQEASILIGNDSLALSKDTLSKITLFTGTCQEGKTYLHWKIVNQKADGYYVVYRSSDKQNYQPIGKKKGIGVPGSLEIVYYLIDQNLCGGVVYYKLLHVSNDKTFFLTESIAVNTGTGNYLTTAK